MTRRAVDVYARDNSGRLVHVGLSLDQAKEMHAQLDGFLKLDHAPLCGISPFLTVLFDTDTDSKDAERYRWLKNTDPGLLCAIAWRVRAATQYGNPTEAIDAAMVAGK